MTPFDDAQDRHDRHEKELYRLREQGNEVKISLTRLDEKMGSLIGSVNEIMDALKHGYVTTAEFDPVKRIVYGLVGAVLLGVIGAVLALVLKGNA